MAPPPEMRYWLPWTRLIGSPNRLTLSEFRGVLRKMPRSSLLIACARLSAVFHFGPDGQTVADKAVAEEWIPKLFPAELAPRVQAFAKQDWVIFFQGQLRFLAAEALRSDTEVQNDPPPLLPDNILGSVLLGSAELLYKEHQKATDDLDDMLSWIADFLPIYEIDSPNDPFMLFLRFYIYLTVIIPRLPDNLRTFDVSLEFEKAFGFPLRQYYLFVLSVIMHALHDREKKSKSEPYGGSFGKEWFQRTNLKAEEIAKLFEFVSCTLDSLPDSKKTHGYADFEFLRDHPYFLHQNQLYCLDYEYAVAKLESGALWRVRSALPESRRAPYFSFWGEVFEEYVAWLFEEYADRTKNKIHRAPKLLDGSGHPVSDAVVRCGGVAVIIEVKLATCAAEVRYSGNYNELKKYFETKLISGKSRKVGVSQLLRAIESVVALPESSLPECLRGVKKIIPLIITRDDIGSSWMTNAYLNARFRRGVKRKWKKRFQITPLVSMSVATLERAAAALRESAFSDILEDRIRKDKNLGKPFEAATSYAPKGTPRMLDKHVAIMRQVCEDMIEHFGIKEDEVLATNE